MLSRTAEKVIRKLNTKKYRWQMKLFIAEGRKVVQELLDAGLTCKYLLVKEGCTFDHPLATTVDKPKFEALSQLDTADELLAVFEFPELPKLVSDMVVVLDKIVDPGNLGTIIRSCDWFGVKTIHCVKGTADAYNSKTIQSTMGSIARVKIEYNTEENILALLQQQIYEIWCADMDGMNYREAQIPSKLALVMGSESHGPSSFWKNNSKKVTITSPNPDGAESLNVAIATAILLSHFRA